MSATKKPTSISNREEQTPATSTQPSQSPQSQKILHRNKQALIADIKKEGEKKYKTYTLFEGDTEKFIEAYQDHAVGGGVDYRLTPPEQIEDYGRGGVLLMEKADSGPKLLWNSIFNMREMPRRIEVRDINNDGIKAILSYWNTGKFDSELWIFSYSQTEKTFHLISPLFEYAINGEKSIVKLDKIKKENLTFKKIDGLYSLFGAQDVQVKDLDNDQIEEVTLIELDDYRQDSPNEAEYPHTKNTKIYKWDSQKQEYYLWKEEKIGEEKSEP